MHYLKLENGVPTGHCILQENLESFLTDVDFSTNPPPAFIETKGFAAYEHTDKPCCGPYEEATEVAPVKGEDGIWRQTWEVTVAIAAKQKALDTMKLKEITAIKRAELQRCTDAVASEDTTADEKAAFLTYKNALLNLDTSDPFNVTWPSSPGMEQA